MFTIISHLSRASEAVFYEKEVIEGFLADNHHCQSSIVGKSESYNELFRHSMATEFCREFVGKNVKNCAVFSAEDCEDDCVEVLLEQNSCKEFKKTFFWETNRKSLSAAIWLKVALEEAIDRDILEREFFGPKLDETGQRTSFSKTLHAFMEKINNTR